MNPSPPQPSHVICLNCNNPIGGYLDACEKSMQYLQKKNNVKNSIFNIVQSNQHIALGDVFDFFNLSLCCRMSIMKSIP